MKLRINKEVNRGFTLIELLVVIAIIGILASVVLASLNSARSSGSDASKKATLNNMRAQAELFRDGAGGYLDLCSAADADNDNGSIANYATALDDTIAQAVTAASATCNATTGAYAMQATLSTSPVTYYCIDSTGFGGIRNNSKGSGTACAAS